MVNLTDKEKKIILVKYIVHGVSPYADASLEVRIQLLKSAFNSIGLKFVEKELMDIGQACLDFQSIVNESVRKFLGDNNDTLIHAHTQMHKGNDKLIGLLGKDFVDEATTLLNKGGK